MAELVTHIGFDRGDLEAYKADLIAIALEFGGIDEAEVQPHRRAAFRAEMKRASDCLGKCVCVWDARS